MILIKIVIAPDSYKGTLTASEVAGIMYSAVREYLPDAEIYTVPVADGGEGTIDALRAKKIKAEVKNPFFEPVGSFYGDFNGSAVVECAACCGLSLAEGRENPLVTTTFGMGELIKKALDDGYKKTIIALGGSSTNDCGCGMAAALGVRFSGDHGTFIPAGGTLREIRHIDMSGLDERIRQVSVTAMCDIDNPLFGPDGAAFVFAPQKGADAEQVKILDDGLRHIAEVMVRDIGRDVSCLKGAGAAGGLGAAVSAFLNGKLMRGIDVVLDAVDFDGILDGTSLVLTGEGRFDGQSINGKVISGLAEHTKKAGIPLISVSGSVEDTKGCYDTGITAIFSIQRKPLPFCEAVRFTKKDLYAAVGNVIRTFTAFKS